MNHKAILLTCTVRFILSIRSRQSHVACSYLKMGFFFPITFILLWWDFLKPALFNSGDAVLVIFFLIYNEKHYHLLNQNVINLTFQHFPSEQDSAQQTWWYSCWNVRCLTKGLIRQFKKTLCVRGVWNTLIVILDAGIFMSQINSSLVSQCHRKEAMWLSQEVVWNAAVNLEA